MLGIILAAVTVGARPVELVKPGEEAAYAAWLDGKVHAMIGANAGKDCSAATLKAMPIGGPPAPSDPVRQALPNAYFYYEYFEVAGCGPADVQRVLVRREGNEWRSIALAPGRTVASFILQKDMVKFVVQATAVQIARQKVDCKGDAFAKSLRISDTQVTTAFTSGKPWMERWVANACGQDYPVDVSLTPTADGGTDIVVRENTRAP